MFFILIFSNFVFFILIFFQFCVFHFDFFQFCVFHFDFVQFFFHFDSFVCFSVSVFFLWLLLFSFFDQKRFLKTQANYNVESRRFGVIMTPFSRQSEEVTEVMRRNQIFALLTDEVSKKRKEKE